jgi:hypothetical protein
LPRSVKLSLALGALLSVLLMASVSGHEEREVGDYTFDVGFLNEPAYSGEQNGLFLHVSQGDEPVEGLEDTLQATVSYGDQTRDLELSPSFSEPGAYEAVFFPTAAGAYTFHITGQVEDLEIDEEFTSGPDTFAEVQDVTGGQFPVQLPPAADVARDAEAGAGAATTATIALVAGIGGLLAGLVALGIALTARGRRS